MPPGYGPKAEPANNTRARLSSSVARTTSRDRSSDRFTASTRLTGGSRADTMPSSTTGLWSGAHGGSTSRCRRRGQSLATQWAMVASLR